MQLTLKQARRAEREIGKELDKETSRSSYRGDNTVSVYESLYSKVADAQETLLSNLTKVKELARIRFSIRKDIETQNETAGLNKLMNREAELKYMANILDQMMSVELSDAELEIAAQRHRAAKDGIDKGVPTTNRYGQPSDEITLGAIIRPATMETLRVYAQSIQRELVTMSDQLAALNASAKVVVSEDDAKLLESYGIIL